MTWQGGELRGEVAHAGHRSSFIGHFANVTQENTASGSFGQIPASSFSHTPHKYLPGLCYVRGSVGEARDLETNETGPLAEVHG